MSIATVPEAVVALPKARKFRHFRENSPSFVLEPARVDDSPKLPVFCTFWMNIVFPKMDWKKNLNHVADLKTEANFNGLIECTRRTYQIAEIIPSFELSFFRTGIKPMAESDANVGGGRFVFRLDEMDAIEVDNVWLAAMRLFAHQKYCFSDDMCGLRLKFNRKVFFLEFWFRPFKYKLKKYDIFVELMRFLPSSCSKAPYFLQKHRKYD